MAGAQEEPGLSEPANRAAEVRTVDCEDLKLVVGDTTNPAWDITGLTVPTGRNGIAEVDQTGLAYWKIIEWAEVDPRFIA